MPMCNNNNNNNNSFMKLPVLFKTKVTIINNNNNSVILLLLLLLLLYSFFLSFFPELICSSLSDLRDKDEVASALRTAVGSKQVCCCYSYDFVCIEHQ